MGPADEVDVVFLEELFDHGLAEGIAHATVILTPGALSLLWVRPQQVTEKPILRHLGRPGDLMQLGHANQLW